MELRFEILTPETGIQFNSSFAVMLDASRTSWLTDDDTLKLQNRRRQDIRWYCTRHWTEQNVVGGSSRPQRTLWLSLSSHNARRITNKDNSGPSCSTTSNGRSKSRAKPGTSNVWIKKNNIHKVQIYKGHSFPLRTVVVFLFKPHSDQHKLRSSKALNTLLNLYRSI